MLDRGRSQGRSRATLVLEDGAAFEGWTFAGDGEVAGEVVFTTSMVGYQETITDPSYRGQILLFTYPLIGNYGVIPGDEESRKVQAKAVLVREYTPHPSNWASDRSLAALLDECGVLGVEGIDTRALTRHLRDRGAMRGVISTSETDRNVLRERANAHPSMIGLDLASTSSELTEPTVLPAFGEERCRAVALGAAVETLRPLLGEVPTFGICLGHQLLGLALDCETYKLPFGHHGANHPVRNLKTGRIEI